MTQHRPSPPPGQIKLHITPQRGGILTRWRLTGSLVTAVPCRELRLVFGKLSRWSGSPIEIVLPVDDPPEWWMDSWVHAIDHIPEPHLVVGFDLPERCRRG